MSPATDLQPAPSPEPGVPLCVGLDGTLTPTDTLHESLLQLVRRSPWTALAVPLWLCGGKTRLRRELARRTVFDATHLPVNSQLLAWLRSEQQTGRGLVMITAADRAVACAVGERLGFFDEIIASDGERSLPPDAQRQVLVERFGEQGFDYVGREPAAAPLWLSARRAIVVGDERQVARARGLSRFERSFTPPAPTISKWVRAVRLHQWVKNALIFTPLLLSHRIFDTALLSTCVLAFFAFGLCASSVYLLNDLLDLESDRQHPRKSQRPFASGALPASQGALVSLLLLLGSLALALLVGWRFAGVLAAYYCLTWAYSFRLKRAAIVDVMTLAGLYTIRLIAGAAATGISLSFWLLAFSAFIFLSLGLVKRYTELDDALKNRKFHAVGRGYRAGDLPLLLNLGVTSGCSAIVVVALYINSPDAQSLYRHIEPLWMMCPLLLYWISRVWLLAVRGQMPDDPVVFAIRDKISLALVALVLVIALLAT